MSEILFFEQVFANKAFGFLFYLTQNYCLSFTTFRVLEHGVASQCVLRTKSDC